MIVIQLKGGLGNQMFQYALYLSFVHRGVAACLDLSHFSKQGASAGYELKNVFSIDAPQAGALQKIISKSAWKLRHRYAHVPYKETEESFGWYNKHAGQLKCAYLKGYWQSEKYFETAGDLVRQHFVFPAVTDSKNKTVLEKINNSNAVSLHIRRGDYQQQGRNWSAPLSYYRNAVEYIKDKLGNPLFFIFSDSPGWAADNLQLENSILISHNTGPQSFIDMQLMSSCRHNIIANSSFSWWAAWLNTNPDKIIVAPSPWLPFMEGTRDVVPASWHAMQH